MPLLDHDTAVILLLELQPEIVKSSKTVPEDALRRAIGALVSAGQDLGIPALASVVPLGSAAPTLIGEAGKLSPFVRTTISAFDDARISDAIGSSGRRLLLLAGVSSEIAVLQSAIDARRRGFEVHVLADCCGGLSKRTEATAFRQIEQAGGVISNVSSCLTSFVSDMATPAGQTVMAALAELWSWELPA